MNLYVHFPFCRAKCSYCALLSRAGSTPAARAAYVQARVDEINARGGLWNTVYFGGGTPALCDLAPLFACLRPHLRPGYEFTVELHPADVTPGLVANLVAGGVNRVSLGVQSFCDAVLDSLGRHHTAAQAEAAYELLRAAIPNAGIDVIAGLPGDDFTATLAALRRLRPEHCSCYTLIREPGTRLDLAVKRGLQNLPADDVALGQLAQAEDVLRQCGLHRYEISNFAKPGRACRHNLFVWRGADYVGLGEGAAGRVGCVRTLGQCLPTVAGSSGGFSYVHEHLDALHDAMERALFTLRTRGGFAPEPLVRRYPVLAPRLKNWRETLTRFEAEGILIRRGASWCLTARGCEVCDSVLAELV